MGGTAREIGFDGWLPDLCNKAELGLYYGCKHFVNLLKKHGDRDKAISSYNQGSPRRIKTGEFKNQDYVDKINKKHEELINAHRTPKK